MRIILSVIVIDDYYICSNDKYRYLRKFHEIDFRTYHKLILNLGDE